MHVTELPMTDEAGAPLPAPTRSRRRAGARAAIRPRRLRPAAVAVFLLGWPGLAGAAALSCSASVAAPPTLRAEGLAELTGDLVLTCTGGTPTATGAQVPKVNISVFVNATPTSRVLSGSWAEPLLLVDEPAPAAQRACQHPTGICSTVGNGTGAGIYDGTPGHPNVYQGQQSGNSISWPGVPIDPPGTGSRVIRMTNIRVNASALAGSSPAPPPVSALVTTSGDIALPITNPNQTLGLVAPSFTVALRNALSTGALPGVISLPQCSSAAKLRIATLRFTESFPGAFRKRNTATAFESPTAVANQNTPGAGPGTETGFFNASLVGDPARGSLATAGLADFGTRLKAVFANVPAGVSVFVDVNGASVSGAAQNTARLTAAEAEAFSAVPEADGLPGTARVAISGGAGTAVWEITDSDPLALNAIEFGVYVSYTANAPDAPAIGTATVAAAQAPTSSVVTASAGPVPRFLDGSVPGSLFSVTACGGAPALVAAVLPGSRSAKVGNSVTVFATVINTGSDTALGCTVAPVNTIPATFTARTTNAANQIVGSPPVDIPIGTAQNFLLVLKPSGPITPVDLQLNFDCANSEPAPVTPGVNTLLFSASATGAPDIVALAATSSQDGIVNVPGATGSGAFAVAAVNLGTAGSLVVSADTGAAILPVRTFVCETSPATGACLAPPAPTVTTQINAGATPTFAVFVAGTGAVPFNPATNRVFIRFKESGGATRGTTSVAVRTQ
jgi:hypothetical protein